MLHKKLLVLGSYCWKKMCDAKESGPDVANEILIYVFFKLLQNSLRQPWKEFAIPIEILYPISFLKLACQKMTEKNLEEFRSEQQTSLPKVQDTW